MGITLESHFTGVLQVSADLSYGTLTGTAGTANRGVGLGFNTSDVGAWNTFTGIRLPPDSELIFQSKGTVLATVNVSTSSNTFYRLGYDVDVVTGEISNSSLTGSTADFSAIYTASVGGSYFSGASNLSLFAGGSAAGQYGYTDNLPLSAIPEPSAYGTILGVAVLGWGPRRRHQARATRGVPPTKHAESNNDQESSGQQQS